MPDVGYPEKLIIALTNRCDAGCTFCYRRRVTSPALLPGDTFRALVDELGPGLQRLRFAGAGEPLLAPNFPEFALYVQEHQPHVKLELTSNASLLDARAARVLGGFDRLWLSLNAVTPETKAVVMPGLMHRMVLDNVRRAVALDGPTVRLSFLTTKDNWHEAEQFVGLALGLGCDRITIQALDRALNEAIWREQQPPRAEFEPVLARLRANGRVEVPPLAAFYAPDKRPRYPVQCGNVGQNFGVFYTTGEVVFCCYMAAEAERWSVGNIYEQGALDIWRGSRAAAFRTALGDAGTVPDVCWKCNNYWSKSGGRCEDGQDA
jgi:radical SAM protein with 4Fe4S-binding SPASM domain